MDRLGGSRSIYKVFSILLLASMLLSNVNAGGTSTAAAQVASTETPTVDPSGTPTGEPGLPPATETALADAQNALQATSLPTFSLPYGWDPDLPNTYEPVMWSGGPHKYGDLGTQDTIAADLGSGMDFSAGSGYAFDFCNKQCSFIVRSMADGQVIYMTQSPDGQGGDSFGKEIAVRSNDGGSVIIYGHLYNFFPSLAVGSQVGVGSALGRAGHTHAASIGDFAIHLHVELRDGSGTCTQLCLGTPARPDYQLGGNPLSWNGVRIGDYTFYEYRGSSSASSLAYNYDGVAVANYKVSGYSGFTFPDEDYYNSPPNATNYPSIYTWLPDSFKCEPLNTNDCETNNNFKSFPYVVFSNGGKFGGGGVFAPASPPGSTMDNSVFLSDITIPDGTAVSPVQSLVKTWRIKNTGSSTWGAGYKLAFVNGEKMGAPDAVDVPSTAPGQQVDLTVNMVGPSTSGAHNGNWRLRNPQGTYFGDSLWIRVSVAGSNPGGGNITMLDLSPASPSAASTVHIVGRIKSFSDFRSMRFKMGNEVHEMPSPVWVGGQYQISYDWNTGSLPRGDYAIMFEVAKTGDPNWANPERQVKTYTLTGTPASTNRPPDRPAPKSPYDWYLQDSSGSPASVQLCAYPSSDPDGNGVQYWFEVKDQGGGVYTTSGWTSSACWSHTYGASMTYSWRVKASDGSAESDWSNETWHFSVAGGGVYIGSYSFFQQDTNNTHMCVFVTYDGIQGPDVYAWINMAADNTESGDWRLLDHYGPNTTPDCTQSNYHGFWIRSPYYATGTHKIKVSAIKKDSGANATMMTSLNIGNIVPPAPDVFAPSSLNNNGTWWNSRTINFQWGSALRAQSYTVRASTNSNPWADGSPVFNQTVSSSATSLSHAFGQDYGQLYWSVRATDAAGSADSGGNAWFGIDQVNPTCHVQALPAVSYDNVFQVNWTATDNSAGVGSSDIQYRDSTRNTWNDWLLNASASKPYELFTGQPGHTYFFRCRSTDNAGNMGAYPGAEDTFTKVDPAARPAAAWWNTAWTGKLNLTILNNMPSAALPVGYPVHLHFDGGTSPTAAAIYADSLSSPKCNDLRVVYNDTTELNRVVDRCDATAIDFWFRTGVSIAGGSSNNTAHQLYFGNASSGAPAADPNQVWYPYRESDTQYLYFFQEGSGSTAHDSSGHGRNCSMNSSVQWAPSLFDNGLRFNHANSGDSRSLNCGAAASLSSFTIEFWYRPDQDDGGKMAGELAGGGNGGGGNNWALSLMDGHIRFDVWPCGPCGSAEVHSDFNLLNAPYVNNWSHVAVSFNGSNEVKFYLNGNLDSTKYLSQSGINTYAPPLEIGSVEGINQVKANMGAFRISSGVKSSFPYGAFAIITSAPSLAAGTPVNPPGSGTADLAVLNLSAYPNPGGGALVEAVVQNQGDLSTQSGFYTDIYLDHIPTGPGDYASSLRFWVDDPIDPGQTVTLTTVVTNLAGLASKADSNGRSATSSSGITESSGTLYAQTDSAGSVHETDKQNNIYAPGTQICAASADSYGNDGTPATASSIAMGTSQTHNFDVPGDQDWVKFTAQAGQQYTIATTNLGISADTYLYLYDTNGQTVLASNDDFNNSLASQIVWTAPQNGTYYVLATNWNPNTGGCGTQYGLSLASNVVSNAAVRMHPSDGAQVCRRPQVGVELALTDLLRKNGSFDPSTVVLKLDNKDVTGSAVVSQTETYPASKATLLYTPTSDLALAYHLVSVTYAAASGPITVTWGFTATSMACGATVPNATAGVDSNTHPPVTGEQANQQFSTTRAPEIAALYPAQGSQACLQPSVGVALRLTDLLRQKGSFDPSTVVLKLDGTDVTGSAVITQNETYPVGEATLLYTPTADLAMGDHQASLTYAAASGPMTVSWGFTITAMECAAPGDVPYSPSAPVDKQAP